MSHRSIIYLDRTQNEIHDEVGCISQIFKKILTLHTWIYRRRSKPSGYAKIESSTEKSAIYIDEKVVQTHTRDVHSEKCGQETDTSTLADSLDVRRDNERNPVPPMSSSPTVHQRPTLGLKQLGSRIGAPFKWLSLNQRNLSRLGIYARRSSSTGGHTKRATPGRGMMWQLKKEVQ